MNADGLAKLFKRAKSSADFHGLILAIGERTAEIRERQQAISSDTWVSSKGSALDLAEQSGPDAVSALEAERAALAREREYLERLEWQASERSAEVLKVEAAKRVRAGLDRLPQSASAVHQALEQLDRALAVHAQVVEDLSRYEAAGLPFPLVDAAAAGLIDLRDAVWRRRMSAVLAPAFRDESLPLAVSKYWEENPEKKGSGIYRARMSVPA